MFRRFMARWSEVYRIENGYGVSIIRNNRELRALIRFCKKAIKEGAANKKSKHYWVWMMTVAIYEGYSELVRKLNQGEYRDERVDWSVISEIGNESVMWFIEEYVGYYWT